MFWAVPGALPRFDQRPSSEIAGPET